MLADAMTTQLAASTGRIKRAWIAAILHIRAVNPVTIIAVRLTGRHEDVLAGVGDAGRHFAAEQHAAYVAAGQAEARWLAAELGAPAPIRKKLLGFDISDPPATAWAAANQLDKVREITQDQRDMLRQILLRAARISENPLVTAKAISESIGLTAAQVDMVESYRAALVSGQYAAALDRQLSSGVSDRAITAAQAAKRELTPQQIETAVARYRQNAIVMRAQTIARTEGLRVTHQGSDELYRQAIARGDVQTDEVIEEWSTAHDGDVRATHATMHGQTRSYGEPFTSGAGVELRYPGDPEAPANEVIRCRCVKAVRVRPRNRPEG